MYKGILFVIFIILLLIIRILYLKKKGMFCSGKGKRYYNIGFYEESILECNKSLKVNPENKYAKYYKGMSLIRLNQVYYGLIYLNAYLKAEPKNLDGILAKYSVLFYLGVNEKSIDLLNECSDLGKYLIKADKYGSFYDTINNTLTEIELIKLKWNKK